MTNFSSPARPKIAIAATFTAEPILPSLQLALEEAGLALDVEFAPYHQVFQELLTPNSLLATTSLGVEVVLLRLEDFVRDIVGLKESRAVIQRIAGQVCEALGQHARRGKVPTIVAVLSPSPAVAAALLPELRAAAHGLVTHVRSLPGIALLSEEEVDLVSTDERYDSLADEMAHMPFTEEHYASLGLAVARKVHALRVPASKVLVLDCDETLWRGVVGEDGFDGITIPPAMISLQRFACEAQAKGVLICLVSKNAERDVLEVFRRRSDMVLTLDHVVAHRINWEAKPTNIASLARTLNLGLDSFVFIDDNPVECALMRTELPQVVTLQLPPDDEVEAFLSHLWLFDKIAVTGEDKRRTSMYRENAARLDLEQKTTDIAEFIASLKVVVDIRAPADGEWPRIAQLSQRTNQFNFTTVRRNESDMRALVDSGKLVLRVKVSDRFGDYGLVGLVIADDRAKSLIVDTLLLSCRVLGRGVEHTILRWLGEFARERGLAHVDLSYVATPKNEPARAFADSIATDFRLQAGERVIYRIPVDFACGVAHRPGHEPAAVIEARKAEETKASTSALASELASDRSERYVRLARTLQTGESVVREIRAQTTRVRTLRGQAVQPATATERDLLVLWQDVLGINDIGVEDDYFALGGTSLLAAKLFAKIARQFDVKLRLTVILDAPTVRALARHLEPEQIKQFSTLIDLKKGGPRQFFLVHDGDGETLLYLNLAHRLPDDFAVVGLEPRRIPGVPLAHTRIEEMASFYVTQIRGKQPHGPYVLGGMCAGGVIAFEIASQLTGGGECVELLALLDAAMPQAEKRSRRIAKQRTGRLAQAIADAEVASRSPVTRSLSIAGIILRKLVNALKWEMSHRLEQWSVHARFRLLRRLLDRKRAWPPLLPELSVRQIYDSAEPLYVPKPLPGTPTVLIRATVGEANDTPYREIYADAAFGWKSVIAGLTVVDVDGGHSSMLQEPFVESLAEALLPCLVVKSERARTQAETDIVEGQPQDAG
jgi:FkbH-like protein